MIGKLQRENFERAVKAGAKMAFGTDAGVYPHGDNAKQFFYMVKFGMTPAQAIRAATSNAADLIGRAKDVGTLEAGKFADVIAVTDDPLAECARAGKRGLCDERRRGSERPDHAQRLITLIGCGSLRDFRVILALAFRTPPVRGEDRVHLTDTDLKTLRISFLPETADQGTTKGGPSWQIVTFPFVRTLNNLNIRQKTCFAPSNSVSLLRLQSYRNIIRKQSCQNTPSLRMRNWFWPAVTVCQVGRDGHCLPHDRRNLARRCGCGQETGVERPSALA